ncbi:hypothetical protein [Aquipseudomonas ullengensis]|uniref:Uncharacterized protein n=1 Tax=Aquipseudomonas ullengensis TaxID=2759166 RepID=A0A7W4QAK4_9GAMM|nr:hypothetical protein [Pseudomonas ullengensis]MBB2495947.1 hypothetical protein [Pseudomonas ullengensis]
MTVVYLDQNKWIELARIKNGKESSDRARQLLAEIDAARQSGFVFPLSAIHIMEFSRIKDPERRARLGKVMWEYSAGITTTPLKIMLCWELEVAFASKGYAITPEKPSYLGQGIAHAFGEQLDHPITAMFSKEIDKAMLCGMKNTPPIQWGASSECRDNFANHLRSIHKMKGDLERDKWEDWMYAISMADIVEPLHIVMSKYKIPVSEIETWGVDGIKSFMDSMPTRKLDIHLHRQVLQNPNYKPKHSDLEDWAGLGPAMCYADIVVCEKHFADLACRSNYQHNSRVETSIYNVF